MKIALVSPYSWAHPGGVNSHIEGLSRELIRRGHEVTVIAPDKGTAVPGAAFESAGRSVPIPANGSIAHIALMPGTKRRVERALSKGSFDVVHVHEPLVPFVSTSAVRGSKSRVIGTFHAAGEGRSNLYRLARTLFKNVHARLDYLIAVSESARDLVSTYFPGEYEIVPNGIDTKRFRPGGGRPDSFPASGGPFVLFVGRNEPRKGLGVLLEAFPAVAREMPGCRLIIAGSGFEQEKVERVLPKDVRDQVSVVGFVSNEELPSYYSSADIFCAPALRGESFGIILIEAIACGTPVVASHIPGYRAVVEQTGAGRIFNTGDAMSLAQVLHGILLDEEKRSELIATGLESVQRYSWDNLTSRLEEIYSG